MTLAWFWFLAFLLSLAFIVYLMATLDLAKRDVRVMRRRMHQQGLNFLDAIMRGDLR